MGKADLFVGCSSHLLCPPSTYKSVSYSQLPCSLPLNLQIHQLFPTCCFPPPPSTYKSISYSHLPFAPLNLQIDQLFPPAVPSPLNLQIDQPLPAAVQPPPQPTIRSSFPPAVPSPPPPQPTNRSEGEAARQLGVDDRSVG